MTGGLRDAEFLDDRVKAVAVLRSLNGGAVGADDLYAAIHQRLGEVDRGLTA